MIPFGVLYHISLLFTFLVGFLNGLTVTSDEGSPLKIIIHMGVGTRSHIRGIFEIASILSQRNHTFIYASLEENESYSKGYPFPFKSLGSSAELDKRIQALIESFFSQTGSYKQTPRFLNLKGFSENIALTYETVYPTLKKLVEIEKPDLIMCDFFSPACGDVAELQNIPFVTGYQTIDGFGITKLPFITSDRGYGPISINELTFFERFDDKIIFPVKNFFQHFPIIQRLNKVKEQYGVPTSMGIFKDFYRNLGLSITFDGFEPVIALPPNIKIIGPVFSDLVPELDSKLSTFLDSYQRIIYVAFGSNALLVKYELDKLMQSILHMIETDVIDGAIWGIGQKGRHEFSDFFSFQGSEVLTEDLFSGNLPQLRLLRWAPQVTLLNHKNVKLFLSHGGLESILESIDAGKPILALSLMGDQPRNARKIVDIGIGEFVDRYTFTLKSLAFQVTTILEDKGNTFSSNVNRLKAISKFGRNHKYLAADLIEGYAYTAKACRPSQPHKWGEVPCEARHLVPASYHMYFIKYELLDVYFAALLLLLVFLSITSYIFYKLMYTLFNRIVYYQTHVKKE